MVKSRIMQRLMPHNSTLASMAAELALGLGYVWFYIRILKRISGKAIESDHNKPC
jgi:hypothetical protein